MWVLVRKKVVSTVIPASGWASALRGFSLNWFSNFKYRRYNGLKELQQNDASGGLLGVLTPCRSLCV